MSTCNVTISRKKQFRLPLASYIVVKIDGVVCGKISNGSSISCAIEEGHHEISFKWIGVTSAAIDVCIPRGLQQLNIDLKFNKRTGNLAMSIDESVSTYIHQQEDYYDESELDDVCLNDNMILEKIDKLDGVQFENWCAEILKNNGFINVEVTRATGDQGVDILAEKGEIRYAIQCKCYSSNLGNSPIQEVHAGKSMYKCHVGVVMTNSYFTSAAKELANATGVLLWDREKLLQMMSLCQDNVMYSTSENELDVDPLLREAIMLAVENGQISVGLVQRKLRIKYLRASRIIDEMEDMRIIGKFGNGTTRKVIMSKDNIARILNDIN